MAPLTPHWKQPSHPIIQEVIINDKEYSSKSLSKVALPPFAVFAKMAFPPCTVAAEPTSGESKEQRKMPLLLASSFPARLHQEVKNPAVLRNPDTIFDTASLNILAGPKGLQPGDELTFFYPSTEWSMAQPFTCLCNRPSCRGTISGAKDMKPSQLEGLWLSPHIRLLLENPQQGENSISSTASKHLDETLKQELDNGRRSIGVGGEVNGSGAGERGPTSRELSGEMGGDTIVVKV
ncbi:hypothetical protein E4U35_006607 [Claviceps purpurea]|nr:hypothetical protein E4U37_001184 [Claviceps purpurea]KAG6209787.1 hypothetical protein E4U35_006607 [Claviceps purpurea]KAG6245360.1 hypothetical protein E4U24_004449 [Claviceps purpurea]